MCRFQILFPARMMQWLRAEAERRGTSVVAVVRMVIQAEMDKEGGR